MGAEHFTPSRDKDLALLKRTRRSQYTVTLIKFAVVVFGLLLGTIFALYTVQRYRGEGVDIESVELGLDRLNAPWSDALVETERDLRDWIERRGTATEYALFEEVAAVVLNSAHSIGSSSEEGPRELSFGSWVLVAIHGGALRLAFLFVAGLRVWLIAIGIGVFFGLRAFRVYDQDDLLGQTGNNRLFFSGIRGDLSKVTPEGAPDRLVRGLTCLNEVSVSDAHRSEIWHLLGAFDAACGTTEALVRHLLAYQEYPAYVAPVDEDKLLADAFRGASLVDHAVIVLRAVLELHQDYQHGDVVDSEPFVAPPGPRQSHELIPVLKSVLHRVVTPGMRHSLAAMPNHMIAAVVLGLEAGKILTFEEAGGRWIRRSNYPHLNARAVLHSIVAFPADFDNETRTAIRRALVYARRKSAFSPVRMPIDLSRDQLALRQWAEVLISCPHELETIGDELEMNSLIREAHVLWMSEFLDGSMTLLPEVAKSSYSTPSNLLFVKLENVMKLLRRCIPKEKLARFGVLLERVSNRQKLELMESQLAEERSEEPHYERLISPIPPAEISTLADLHGVSPEFLREWSTLRTILTSFGWLASRVGDYSMPDSYITHGVFTTTVPLPGANSLGLLGVKGVVPFRGTRLESRWGKNWSARFVSVTGATIAEKRVDYEKLLTGQPLDDKIEPEAELFPSANVS